MKALWLCLFALTACPSPPPPIPPTPDADSSPPPPPPPVPVEASTACTAACDRLRTLGCPEGKAPDCAPSLDVNAPYTKTPYGKPLTCSAVAQAATVAAERALGIGCGQ